MIRKEKLGFFRVSLRKKTLLNLLSEKSTIQLNQPDRNHHRRFSSRRLELQN